MFQLSGITKGYGGHALFSDLTMRIDAGDRIGLVGPNGVGKTTLLRILTGEESADDGDFAMPRGTSVGYLAQEVRTATVGTVLERTRDAVPEIDALEAAMTKLEAQMGTAPPDEAERLAHEHGEKLERYQRLDGYGFDARARVILAGLGFLDEDMDKPIATLSGGWGMRVELARLLLARPELLLLDEPTNHLDLESLQWLEEFLQDYEGAWLVVSHDRYFLNRMVNKIVDLGLDSAFVFPGNYDKYVEAREEIDERLAKESAQREKRMQEIRAFVERFRAKATKARQAQSRAKMLEKMEKELEENPAPPKKRRRRSLRVTLPQPVRSGDVVIRLEGVAKAYGDNVVYTKLDFYAQRGDKVALVGVNGAGKSTMLKLLAQELRPDKGARALGHNVTPYYFAQHQIDTLNVKNTVLQELWTRMPEESESRVRGILGAFLFPGDDVEKIVGVLSGGEKSRLALAKMLAKPPNLLLLDEPTNHLDLESREVLEKALGEFGGTIIFISHDRYFINRVATKVAEIHVGGKINEYPGDYDYYLWKRAEAEARAQAAAKPKSQAQQKSAKKKKKKNQKGQSAQADREAQKKSAREAAKKKRKAEQLETTIADAEGRIKEIDTLMCDPEIYADAAQSRELLSERGDLEETLKKLYAKWERLAG